MTREEATKVLEKQFDESCGDYRYQNKDKLDYEDALWLAIAALRELDAQEKQESFGEWISVKDKMPQPGRYVACIAKRNPFSRFMPMVARIEKNGWANPITEQYISEVTHWLPLPEPPKEGKSNEM